MPASPREETADSLNSIIIVSKPNIPQPPPPTTPPARPPIRAAHTHTLTKLIVALRPLVLRVASQHTLNTHADALDALHGAPARGAEEIQTDDAVGVDVWVDGDGAGGGRGRCR